MNSQWRWITASALALACFPSNGVAQQPLGIVDGARGRTIDQLVALALEQAPTVLAARSAIDEARGQRRQAASIPNPSVTSTWKEGVGGPDHEVGVDVQWPLNILRRHARIVTADQMIDVASLSVQDRERLLAAGVREQAGRVLTAARIVAVTDELVALNRRSRSLLEARVKEGATPELELNLVDVEVRRLEADRATQAADAQAALIDLKALVGLQPDAELQLRDDLEQVVRAQAPPAQASAEAAVSESVAARPDVREGAARVRLASARVEESMQEGSFEWSLYGSYSRMAFGFPLRGLQAETGSYLPINDVFHYVTIGATVGIPLVNRNQGAVAAAKAAQLGAEHDARARELSARAELAAATTRDREARRAMDLYASGIRDLSRRNLDVVREAYTLGRTPLFNVFEEQRRFLDIERAYTEALSRAYDARTSLRRALGDVQ